MKHKADKKAWLKIVEAVIAILIVLSAMLYITLSYAPKKNISAIAYDKEKYILNAISKDESLRADILSDNNAGVNTFASQFIPSSWGYETRICSINDICEGASTPSDKEVYASEIVITSYIGVAGSKYEPRKLRMFVWVK